MKLKILTTLTASLLLSVSLYAQNVKTGTVLESMNRGGYTYVKIKESNKTYWLAVKETTVKVNEKFSYTKQMWANDFNSKTLNKTFDKIMFAKVAKISKKKSPKKATALKIKTGQIANIIINKDKLKNTTVSVEGKVTKVSRGIMKTSWIHIKDKAGNKLIFRSTNEDVNVNDIVKAQGTLHTDVDYGYGYKYEAIVVNSSFNKM